MEAGGVVSIFLSMGLCVSLICNIIQYYSNRKLKEKIMLIKCSNEEQKEEEVIKIIEKKQRVSDVSHIDPPDDASSEDASPEGASPDSESIILLEESQEGNDIFDLKKKNVIQLNVEESSV
jgi:hypothetical protein